LFFYVLWYFLSPIYNEILVIPSELFLKLSEVGSTHITNSMQVQGKIIVVQNVASENNPENTIIVKNNVIHFDMVLLFALIWAVPDIPFKKRKNIFLWGFGIVFVLHLIKIFIFVKHSYSLHIQIDGMPYSSPFMKRTYYYLNHFILLVVNQIFPVLIWSLLYWKYWREGVYRRLSVVRS
jgi:hypothetical protein